jgi:hypothetical protein
MAHQLPDSPGELEYIAVGELRDMAVQIGRTGGRGGWPKDQVTRIRSMSKEEVINFILRNHYKNPGH